MSEVVKTVELSFLVAFVTGVILGPIVIPFLKKLKFGQYIREEGPEAHKSKAGTPTMGGIIFLVALCVSVLISCFVLDDIHVKNSLAILAITLIYGLIGFGDDFIKVVMKRNLGLTAIQKMSLQFIGSALFAAYLVKIAKVGTKVNIPYTGFDLELGFLFVPFVMFVIIGTANGSNFTDGLDGLASSVTIPIAVFLGVVSIKKGAGVECVCFAFAGALVAFLIFNTYPARVFMGDTGSLALGAFVSGTAFILKMPIVIVIIAFIYFAEVVSVILQVLYFKKTGGKRLFKMAPIHHHFELCGYAETQVVCAFAVTTTILCLLAYLSI